MHAIPKGAVLICCLGIVFVLLNDELGSSEIFILFCLFDVNFLVPVQVEVFFFNLFLNLWCPFSCISAIWVLFNCAENVFPGRQFQWKRESVFDTCAHNYKKAMYVSEFRILVLGRRSAKWKVSSFLTDVLYVPDRKKEKSKRKFLARRN